ncbi:uncharacterized protein LOC110713740 [Chenopodium quinoa]|uniref:uncharacterized protein LOC110713740 n=1 Tax=Chenopodium quinoa TaxID=63459 RepID=UPI000B78AC1C|nr:uncharacterized protein LOC110713740 [Chenopodium quinoa]
MPITLDYTNVHYFTWVKLFENHACAYNVLDHIDPKTPKPTDISDAFWTHLDAIVKHWIYGTISVDLLNTMLSRKATAQQILDRIKEIFQDNKSTMAVYLENQFNTLHLDNFANVTTCCQQLKSIANQLANVDQPISDQKLVLRLVAGLNKTDFDTVATMIAQSEPLPSFNTARSRLLVEETRWNSDSTPPPSVFVAQQQSGQQADSSQQQPQQPSAGRGSSTSSKGRGGGGKGRGKGRGRGGPGRGAPGNPQ